MKWVAVLHAAIFQEQFHYHGRMSRGTVLQKEATAPLKIVASPSKSASATPP